MLDLTEIIFKWRFYVPEKILFPKWVLEWFLYRS